MDCGIRLIWSKFVVDPSGFAEISKRSEPIQPGPPKI